MVALEIIIAIIFFFAIFYLFRKTTKGEVKYVTSDIDGEKYLVRDLKDKQHAANMLARIKKKIMDLTNYLSSNNGGTRGDIEGFKDYSQYIDQLSTRIRGVVISENGEDNAYTSYSVNKGEQIVFCLRSKYNKNKLHNMNLITYVALHEMAHVACPEEGHTPLFKEIFAFLTKIAMERGLYQKIPFDDLPQEYCGLMITDSIV